MKKTLLLIFLCSSISLSSQTIYKIRIQKPKKGQCSGSILGKTGGKISYTELLSVRQIETTGPCDYKVISFVLVRVYKGIIYEWKGVDEKIEMIPLSVIRPGEKFWIEKIYVLNKVSGHTLRLPNLKFIVTN